MVKRNKTECNTFFFRYKTLQTYIRLPSLVKMLKKSLLSAALQKQKLVFLYMCIRETPARLIQRSLCKFLKIYYYVVTICKKSNIELKEQDVTFLIYFVKTLLLFICTAGFAR